ncbi:hypothetical protein J3A83DRAFT_1153892 [Scleroderma citrinum]
MARAFLVTPPLSLQSLHTLHLDIRCNQTIVVRKESSLMTDSAPTRSLNTETVAACAQPRIFEDILERVHNAIQFEDDVQEQRSHSGYVSYQRIIASHASQHAQNAVEWMEGAETAFPVRTDEGALCDDAVRYGVFLWVCELMKECIAVFVFLIAFIVCDFQHPVNRGILHVLQSNFENTQNQPKCSRPTLQ